jgi:serine/threonine-protein kinase
VLGRTVGSYQILGKIAEGGMGVVYKAQHALIGKQAAIKVLLPELSANQDVVNRFFNEARAATAIRHPGIVEIFDFGYMPDGMAYIVMEFLDGEPLSKRIATLGRLEERHALSIVRAVASALSAAHAKGIIHRDLKPDNIFLVPDPDMPGGERAKLLDFGIAKLTDIGHQGPAGQASSRTRTGAVMGTPTYMSPEQCRGAGEIDSRSDLYSLGCILYEMVTGRPPFVAEGIGEIIGAHLFFAPERPNTIVPTLSAHGEALILQLLAKKPEERVQSAAELARLLGQGSSPILQNFSAPTMALPTSPRLPTGGTYPTPVPTVPGQAPTTLGGAAAEASPIAPARSSRVGLFAGLFAVLAIGGGITAYAVKGGGDGKTAAAAPEATPTPEPTPPPKPEPKPEPTPTPTPVVVVELDAGVEVVTAPDAGVAPTPTKTKTHRDHGKHNKGKGSGSSGPVPIETDL